MTSIELFTAVLAEKVERYELVISTILNSKKEENSPKLTLSQKISWLNFS